MPTVRCFARYERAHCGLQIWGHLVCVCTLSGARARRVFLLSLRVHMPSAAPLELCSRDCKGVVATSAAPPLSNGVLCTASVSNLDEIAP